MQAWLPPRKLDTEISPSRSADNSHVGAWNFLKPRSVLTGTPSSAFGAGQIVGKRLGYVSHHDPTQSISRHIRVAQPELDEASFELFRLTSNSPVSQSASINWMRASNDN